MFKFVDKTITDRGYLIKVDDNISEINIKIKEAKSDIVTFEHTFKIYGNYPNQIEDLVDDCIDMYERKKAKKI